MTPICVNRRAAQRALALRVGRLLIGLMLLSGALTGCSSFNLKKKIPWQPGKDGSNEPPVKIVAVWTDTVMTTGANIPTRGFGGRLMFYDREDGEPIKVDGTLTVYAFEDAKQPSSRTAPDRKYVFKAEQFAKHYSKSQVGHSYSVWLPWDAIGGPKKQISFIVRFTPTKGHSVLGEMSRQLLPGIEPAETLPPPQPVWQTTPMVLPQPAVQPATPPINQGQVQPVSYQQYQPATPLNPQRAGNYDEAQVANSDRRMKMNTTTIALPPSYGNRQPVAIPRAAVIPRAATTMPNEPAPARSTTWPQEPSLPATAAGAAQSGTATPRSNRFGHERSRALGGPISQLERERGPWQPRPARMPSAPPPPPALPPANGSASLAPIAYPTTR